LPNTRGARLDSFGSAVGDRFDVGPGFDHFGPYFDLKECLDQVLGKRELL